MYEFAMAGATVRLMLQVASCIIDCIQMCIMHFIKGSISLKFRQPIRIAKSPMYRFIKGHGKF